MYDYITFAVWQIFASDLQRINSYEAGRWIQNNPALEANTMPADALAT